MCFSAWGWELFAVQVLCLHGWNFCPQAVSLGLSTEANLGNVYGPGSVSYGVRPSLLLGLTVIQTLAQFHSRFLSLAVQILLSPFVWSGFLKPSVCLSLPVFTGHALYKDASDRAQTQVCDRQLDGTSSLLQQSGTVCLLWSPCPVCQQPGAPVFWAACGALSLLSLPSWHCLPLPGSPRILHGSFPLVLWTVSLQAFSAAAASAFSKLRSGFLSGVSPVYFSQCSPPPSSACPTSPADFQLCVPLCHPSLSVLLFVLLSPWAPPKNFFLCDVLCRFRVSVWLVPYIYLNLCFTLFHFYQSLIGESDKRMTVLTLAVTFIS